MDSLFSSDAGQAVKAERVVMNGFLPESILDVARERNIGLVVMGAHNSDAARMAAHDPGTVLQGVIAHAHCPVLTVTQGPLCRESGL